MNQIEFEKREPSWARCFKRKYFFRVEFGDLYTDGHRYLPDGSSPVVKCIAKSWCLDGARRRAILIARTVLKDKPMIQEAEAYAVGYPLEPYRCR